jgi:hypothetical protein
MPFANRKQKQKLPIAIGREPSLDASDASSRRRKRPPKIDTAPPAQGGDPATSMHSEWRA